MRHAQLSAVFQSLSILHTDKNDIAGCTGTTEWVQLDMTSPLCNWQKIRMAVTRSVRFMILVALLNPIWGSTVSWAQTVQPSPGDNVPDRVEPKGEWIEFRQTRFANKPILLHLRVGYERAVLMPEPIRLENESQTLPGCAVEIDTDVVGFYPTKVFARMPIRFVGLSSGTVYELKVRASPEGIRQPLQITR